MSLQVFVVGIVAYTIGVTVGNHVYSEFLYLGYAGVALMIVVSLYGLIRGEQAIMPEIRGMWLFCLWAVLAGAFLAQDYGLFQEGAQRMFQIAVVAFCVAGFSARLRSPALGLGAMLAVSLLLGMYGLLTGDFSSMTEMTVQSATKTTGVQAVSLVSNPNSLGVKAVWGLVAITYFTGATRRLWLRTLLWSLVPLLLVSMVASASRKALVLPFVYLLAWIWFCHRRWVFHRWQSTLPVLAICAMLIWGLPWVMDNTFAGYRMSRALDSEHRDGSTQKRLGMYHTSFELLKRHPLAGVGLSQWPLYGVGTYAHSEYAELAATTGIVGLILYLAPYLLTVRRLCHIRRWCPQESERYRAGLCLALLTTVAVAALGQVLFAGLAYWVLIPSVWGYAFGMDQALLAPILPSHWHARPPRGAPSRRSLHASSVGCANHERANSVDE